MTESPPLALIRELDMILCYGCAYPMKYSFESVTQGKKRYPYCVKCWFWRRVKDVGPADHDCGEVSEGTLTMRGRAERMGVTKEQLIDAVDGGSES